MSGPKCDEIALAEERRRKHEEALRLEKERIKKELEEFDDYMDSVLEQLQQEEAAAEAAFEEDCRREVCMIVEETIEEMGYQIIGSKASDQSTATLYHYDDETAIQVTEAKGQFTMEVVRLDVADRAATAQEADALAQSMESFCGDYQKMKARFRENGLEIRNELFHLPPDSKYACIVNTSDFTMKKEVEKETKKETGKATKKGNRRLAEDYETRQEEAAVQIQRMERIL